MKIGDVKPGVEYGAVDQRRNRADLPRRVTALGVETTVKQVWTGGGYTRADRNVRLVRVRFEDEPTSSPSSYFRNEVATEPKDTEKLLEARFLVAPWKEIRADVHARIKDRDTKADAEAAAQKRIKALLPKRLHDQYLGITAHVHKGKVNIVVRLEGDVFETIIALAEKGRDAA